VSCQSSEKTPPDGVFSQSFTDCSLPVTVIRENCSNHKALRADVERDEHVIMPNRVSTQATAAAPALTTRP
jgi:hypothetical protein